MSDPNHATPDQPSEAESGPRPRSEGAGALDRLPPWGVTVAGLLLLLVPFASVVLMRDSLPDVEASPLELTILPILIAARLIWFWISRLNLIPLIDLPLLGLLFVYSGGVASPLDPALFFIYALLSFSLLRNPRWGFRTWGPFVGGVVAMYGLVIVNVYFTQQADLERFRAQKRAAADLVRQPLLGPVPDRDLDDVYRQNLRARIDDHRSWSAPVAEEPFFAGAHGAFDPGGGIGSLDDAFEVYRRAIETRDRLLHDVAAELGRDLTAGEERALERRLSDGFEHARARIDQADTAILGAIERLEHRAEAENLTLPTDYRRFVYEDFFRDAISASVMTTQEELREGLSEALSGHAEIEAQRELFRADRARVFSERIAVSILILATLYILSSLRFNFERVVQRREAARVERELAVKERDKDNWIALTAGLTHTIGNDILAYDAYGEEALDAIAEQGGDVPEIVGRNLRFIHESNKARLGFIQFLGEFARARKETLEGKVRPSGLTSIAIEPTLREIRRRVGEVEIADLPRESRDPAVVEQRRKFLDLPLEVRFEGDDADDRVIRQGKRGILQFFFYELFKNALRNCSGEVPIVVEAAKRDGQVHLRFINDVKVVADASGRLRLPRITGMEPCSEDQLRARVEEILDQCFEPGRGGGTGLGLFLIRYFVKEYYSGSVSARVFDWSARTVAFELVLPDDLERAFEGGPH